MIVLTFLKLGFRGSVGALEISRSPTIWKFHISPDSARVGGSHCYGRGVCPRECIEGFLDDSPIGLEDLVQCRGNRVSRTQLLYGPLELGGGISKRKLRLQEKDAKMRRHFYKILEENDALPEEQKRILVNHFKLPCKSCI